MEELRFVFGCFLALGAGAAAEQGIALYQPELFTGAGCLAAAAILVLGA